MNGLDIIADFVKRHGAILGIFASASVLLFILSLISIPLIIKRMPEDYFVNTKSRFLKQYSPFVCLLILALKNAAGIILLVSGLIMLLIPGQGILTMVLGLVLINFPGKRRIEVAVLKNQRIRKTLNWFRKRWDLADFLYPD